MKVWKNGTRVISVGSLQIRQDPRIERTEDFLEVKDVTIWDTGTFTCEIEADLENHITVSHFLQVLESARIVDTGGPESMRVRAGTTVSLLCRAEGHPKPKVLWTKLYMGRQTSISDQAELVLDTVTRKDAGQYQCRADNGVGNPKFKKIELLVNYPPEVQATETRVHATVGWSVNMTCQVYADPHATVTWYRGHRKQDPVTDHTQTEVKFEDGSSLYVLTLLPETLEAITNYTCVAQNSLGQGRDTVQLSGLPSAPVISSGELSVSLTSYELVWHTHSILQILAYNILYRKLPSGSIVYAWDSLDVEGDDLLDSRDSSGRVVFQHRTVDNLEQDTAYVAKIKARNIVGWSDFSQEFLFYTRGKDSKPVESRVVDDATGDAAGRCACQSINFVLTILSAAFLI